MPRPLVDSDRFATGRREAHEALESLLDTIRDGRISFGKATLEITFKDAVPSHRRMTVEQTELIGASLGRSGDREPPALHEHSCDIA